MIYANHYKTDLQYFYSYNMFSINFVTYIKMAKDFLVKCYQNNKERLQKMLVTYINSLWKDKENKRQCGQKWYKNLPVDEMQKLPEYRKKYYKIRKNPLL